VVGKIFYFKVISRAYEHQKPYADQEPSLREEWTPVFGSERLTGAILD